MAAQSLPPDEYQKFCDVHDRLVLTRSIEKAVLNEYRIDKNISCLSCETCNTAWIYCPILKQMADIDDFDETGELHGCNAHNKSELKVKLLFWNCKYCGENDIPKCHKCVREDGRCVSDEFTENVGLTRQ